MNTVLSNAATLSNWCAIVVIQELFTLVISFKLLAQRSEPKQNLSRWKKYSGYWKYLVFIPSLLLPTGTFYLQMYLFNTLVNWDFTKISILLAITLPLSLLAITECFRLIYKKMESRILAVFHMEYFLLLPAIFLPVAATAKLFPAIGTDFSASSLYLLLAVAGLEIVITGTFYIYKRRKKHVYCRSNS